MARAPKTQIKEDLRVLSGPDRAAVFLLSLGEELHWRCLNLDLGHVSRWQTAP